MVAITVAGVLACSMLFASGYLVGTGSGVNAGSPQAQPQQQLPPAQLPAADAQLPEQPRNEQRREKPVERTAQHINKAEPTQRPVPTRTVTVKAGQSLWQIAATYAPGKNPQSVVNAISRLNDLDTESAIAVGQKLTIPKYRGNAPLEQEFKTEPVTKSDGPAAIPTGLVIPAIGLDKGLVNLDVVGGALQVPQRWQDVGWWQTGPRPGEAGASVLVGHVDSPSGPAVFYEVSSLREGDMIEVERADSTTATFEVVESVLYSREDFPSERVYREGGPPLLRLITCAGSYNREIGQYSENLVVSARLVTKADG